MLRTGIAQLNLRLGDLAGNARRICDAYDEAVRLGAEVVVFSEMTVTGYPPEDLLLRESFVKDARTALDRVASHTGPVPALVGFPEDSGRPGPIRLWNSAALCAGGAVKSVYRKQLLPNYAVFDERRWFLAEPEPPSRDNGALADIGGVIAGVSICEDLWGTPLSGDGPRRTDAAGAWGNDSPVLAQAAAGAEIILSLNASPYRTDKTSDRLALGRLRAAQTGVPVVYSNQVGGQDELVFDGGSFAMAADGTLLGRCPLFEDSVRVFDVPLGDAAAEADVGADDGSLDSREETWRALTTGIRDYVSKNGFSDVIIGLSGGIDSAAVAALACDALGPARVHGVSMPSRYSSAGSLDDAEELARRLGIRDFRTVPISRPHSAMTAVLGGTTGAGDDGSLTDQNIQSRLRGAILMALANEHGWLVLCTGNKTETSVGYTTLYGDSIGAIAPIGDVPKLKVYDLCRWRNSQPDGPVVPQGSLTKAPSAELGTGQTDEQSLPPYDVLDPLVEAYVDRDLSPHEAAAETPEADLATAVRVSQMVDAAEHKRRQAPPILRISSKSFGKDRRMPITNLYRH